MESKYTTVLDAGAASLPPEPLIIVLAIPVLLLAFAHVANGRSWRSAKGPLQLALWAAYLSYAPLVLYQYWDLWQNRTAARDATRFSIAAGPVDAAAVDQTPDGLFVETSQRFAVSGVNFDYRHQSLRYLDFLLPQADLVTLPLARHAEVRVTYRGEGAERQLLKFEIATRFLGGHD
ncbi:MAG: hypothetical protein R3D05_19390 [Dongiaceae bacterium]